MIAIDKNTSKVQKIQDNCEAWGITCVKTWPFDSRNLVNKAETNNTQSLPGLLCLAAFQGEVDSVPFVMFTVYIGPTK